MLALCFCSPRDRDRLIYLETFETASLMAVGCIFSLAVPVLASLYHALNGIPMPRSLIIHGHSPLFLWVAYALPSNTSSPASCSSGPSDDVILRSSCHARQHRRCSQDDTWGKVLGLGCPILAKSCPEIIVDNEKLDDTRSDYLVALRDGFLPIRGVASSHVEPYSAHRFSRQFIFCQWIPGVLLEDAHSQAVLY